MAEVMSKSARHRRGSRRSTASSASKFTPSESQGTRGWWEVRRIPKLPAAPPSDAAVGPVAVLQSWQPAFVSGASVPQECGRSLLLPTRRRTSSTPGTSTRFLAGHGDRAAPTVVSGLRPPAHHRHDVPPELRYGHSGVVPHDYHTGAVS
ncbi:uncharacterized protein LOC144169284 [Haemaphysalis longicornis]